VFLVLLSAAASVHVVMESESARAVQVTQLGGPEVLQYTEMPVPTPTGGDVLVRVSHAGLNFIDTYFRTGLYKDASKPIPFICGGEGAGTVISAGPDADPSFVGKRVAFFHSQQGSYTTHAVANAMTCTRSPTAWPTKRRRR
jgi:NADPH2:quinone reductase